MGSRESVGVMLSERGGWRSIQLAAILEILGNCSLGRQRRLGRKIWLLTTVLWTRLALGRVMTARNNEMKMYLAICKRQGWVRWDTKTDVPFIGSSGNTRSQLLNRCLLETWKLVPALRSKKLGEIEFQIKRWYILQESWTIIISAVSLEDASIHTVKMSIRVKR